MDIAEAIARPLWWDAVDADVTRSQLAASREADVVIVGAGFTGLWTAYYLKEHDPTLSIVVVEARHVGFGASGRNGGWCHAEWPLGIGVLAKDHGRSEAIRHMRSLFATVDEVGRVAEAEAIDCHYAKGGVLTISRSPLHLRRAEETIDEARALGYGDEDYRLLSREDARQMLGATDVMGGTWSPHGAAIQPALLVHGLAAACESRGVVIHEDTSVVEFTDAGVITSHGTVSAPMVVRATEGFTARLPGLRRAMAPLYSLMVATEPLPDHVWHELGLAARPTFGDFRNLIIYGQRTADGRLAFGGRGAPYHFGSSIEETFDIDDAVHSEIIRVLLELFPALRDYTITHRWGGALGAPRDWRPSVGIDRVKGLAWGGGYIGDGVNTAAMAGRTIADLILERDTDLTTLPWVGHRWKTWEPEPFRWLGINAGLKMAKYADRFEERSGKPSRLGALGNWLRGKSR